MWVFSSFQHVQSTLYILTDAVGRAQKWFKSSVFGYCEVNFKGKQKQLMSDVAKDLK